MWQTPPAAESSVADCACLQVTTGARSDLQQATRWARHMVAECGMSDAIGPLFADQRVRVSCVFLRPRPRPSLGLQGRAPKCNNTRHPAMIGGRTPVQTRAESAHAAVF